MNKSIHRVDLASRGTSRAEQERVAELRKEDDAVQDQAGQKSVPLELHTCWYDDDGNVQCSEDW
jgi:hypothetical protein